jgi:hypothetical protein
MKSGDPKRFSDYAKIRDVDIWSKRVRRVLSLETKSAERLSA